MFPLSPHSGYKLVSLPTEPDSQLRVVGETSVELTLAQYFLVSVVQGLSEMFVSFLQGISFWSPPCSKDHKKNQAKWQHMFYPRDITGIFHVFHHNVLETSEFSGYGTQFISPLLHPRTHKHFLNIVVNLLDQKKVTISYPFQMFCCFIVPYRILKRRCKAECFDE